LKRSSHILLFCDDIAGWRRAHLCGPQARLKSCRPITLKKLGAAVGAAAQELQSARKMAFVGGRDQR
jgi:hypothetical protein